MLEKPNHLCELKDFFWRTADSLTVQDKQGTHDQLALNKHTAVDHSENNTVLEIKGVYTFELIMKECNYNFARFMGLQTDRERLTFQSIWNNDDVTKPRLLKSHDLVVLYLLWICDSKQDS